MSSEGAKGGGGAEGGGIPLTKKKGASVGISAKGKGMSTVAREIDAYKELLLDKSQKRLLTSQEVGEFQCYLNRLQRRLADKRARFEKRARILKMLLQKVSCVARDTRWHGTDACRPLPPEAQRVDACNFVLVVQRIPTDVCSPPLSQ